MPTDPRATRRAAMPEVSRVWDFIVEHFGTPAYFHGVELSNGRTVTYGKKREGE